MFEFVAPSKATLCVYYRVTEWSHLSHRKQDSLFLDVKILQQCLAPHHWLFLCCLLFIALRTFLSPEKAPVGQLDMGWWVVKRSHRFAQIETVGMPLLLRCIRSIFRSCVWATSTDGLDVWLSGLCRTSNEIRKAGWDLLRFQAKGQFSASPSWMVCVFFGFLWGGWWAFNLCRMASRFQVQLGLMCLGDTGDKTNDTKRFKNSDGLERCLYHWQHVVPCCSTSQEFDASCATFVKH